MGVMEVSQEGDLDGRMILRELGPEMTADKLREVTGGEFTVAGDLTEMAL